MSMYISIEVSSWIWWMSCKSTNIFSIWYEVVQGIAHTRCYILIAEMIPMAYKITWLGSLICSTSAKKQNDATKYLGR